MQKRKREFFPTSFAVILAAMALFIMLEAELNFDLILYITINFLFLKVQAAAFNLQSVFKIHLKVHLLSCFRCG